jgi:hypothetical protein
VGRSGGDAITNHVPRFSLFRLHSLFEFALHAWYIVPFFFSLLSSGTCMNASLELQM